MSDTPARRHPNVVNLDEVAPQERLTGTRFGAHFRPLALNTGAKGVGCSHYEIPPGRAAMPRHFHCVNEEAVYILAGAATCRIGEASVAVRAGDWITFPIGPDHAHQIINTSDEPLRYLAFSTRHSTDVVGYPDSHKVLTAALPPGAQWGDKPWIRLVVEESAAVDYFKGEDTGG